MAWSSIPSATSRRYDTPTQTVAGSWLYKCVATNNLTGTSIDSDSAILSVTQGGGDDIREGLILEYTGASVSGSTVTNGGTAGPAYNGTSRAGVGWAADVPTSAIVVAGPSKGVGNSASAIAMHRSQERYIHPGPTTDTTGSPIDVTVLTMAGWIRIDEADTPEPNWELMEKNACFWLNIRNSGENHVLRFGMYTLLNPGVTNYQCDSPSPFPLDGQWHHIAATYDGATQRLFLDGTQVASNLVGLAINQNNEPLNVGAKINPLVQVTDPPNSRKNFIEGAVSNVRLYNRALTSAEIAKLAGASAPPPPSDIKEPGTGLMDRQGNYKAGYGASAIPGIVVDINWKDVETTPHVFNWTTVSAAISTAVSNGKWVTLRINCGVFCPDYVKTAAGHFTIIDQCTDGPSVTYQMPKWWTQAYFDSYKAMMVSAAALWDANSGVGASVRCVQMSGPAVVDPEIMLLYRCNVSYNKPAFVATGVTDAVLLQWYKKYIDCHRDVWLYTNTLVALNDANTISGSNQDSALAILIGDYAQATLGRRFMFQNHSVRRDDQYPQLYDAMGRGATSINQSGNPYRNWKGDKSAQWRNWAVGLQTAQASRIFKMNNPSGGADINDPVLTMKLIVQKCIDGTAHHVELPSGYSDNGNDVFISVKDCTDLSDAMKKMPWPWGGGTSPTHTIVLGTPTATPAAPATGVNFTLTIDTSSSTATDLTTVWYAGDSGDTSGGALASNVQNKATAGTYKFWARVSSADPLASPASADSTTLSVVVSATGIPLADRKLAARMWGYFIGDGTRNGAPSGNTPYGLLQSWNNADSSTEGPDKAIVMAEAKRVADAVAAMPHWGQAAGVMQVKINSQALVTGTPYGSSTPVNYTAVDHIHLEMWPETYFGYQIVTGSGYSNDAHRFPTYYMNLVPKILAGDSDAIAEMCEFFAGFIEVEGKRTGKIMDTKWKEEADDCQTCLNALGIQNTRSGTTTISITTTNHLSVDSRFRWVTKFRAPT